MDCWRPASEAAITAPCFPGGTCCSAPLISAAPMWRPAIRPARKRWPADLISPSNGQGSAGSPRHWQDRSAADVHPAVRSERWHQRYRYDMELGALHARNVLRRYTNRLPRFLRFVRAEPEMHHAAADDDVLRPDSGGPLLLAKLGEQPLSDGPVILDHAGRGRCRDGT